METKETLTPIRNFD
jgi:hypothetical protein